MDTLLNATHITKLAVEADCVGDYLAMLFAVCLLISELMPFYKKHCVDDDNVLPEQEAKTLTRQESTLHKSDGLIHLLANVAKNVVKQK